MEESPYQRRIDAGRRYCIELTRVRKELATGDLTLKAVSFTVLLVDGVKDRWSQSKAIGETGENCWGKRLDGEGRFVVGGYGIGARNRVF